MTMSVSPQLDDLAAPAPELGPALASADPEVYAAIRGEIERQRQQIELIASENIVSPAVLLAQGCVMTN